MADVLDLPPEGRILRDDKRRDHAPDRKDRGSDDRRRDRDSRDKYDDREDRLSRRDYYDRDYKRHRSSSLSPPPLYGHRERDRRNSPSRRSPFHKRSRRDDGYSRGSPDRRIGGGRGRHWPESSPYDIPPRREGLMSYKQFIIELEDDVSPAEAERRYAEYKSEFISTQKKSFFEQNKTEDWLRDKYDPSRLEVVLQRRNELCRESARQFFVELESGLLDLRPTAVAQEQKEGKNVSGEDTDEKRGHIAAKEQSFNAPPKAPVAFSEPRRIEKDVELAQALARKLDNEKGIEKNMLVHSDFEKIEGDRAFGGSGMIKPIVIVRGNNHVKGYEGVELLDVLLTYLWRIHYIDYYGCKEYKEQPKVLRHVRAEGKTNESASVFSEWEKKLDESWQARLQGNDPIELMLAKEKIESTMTQALEPLVRKIKDEKYGWKYGCGAKNCTKLFHGPEFVQKHLKLKHPELVTELSVKVFEDLYFENYMSDPDAPGSLPIMASQKDKIGRPLKSDEHGRSAVLPSNHDVSRDLDKNSKGNVKDDEKIDTRNNDRDNEQSPSRDFQSGAQFEGGRGDTAMFDTFGGPMRGPPPFGTDIGIPPVLMPVPGAGPLGPFVPAPPEVAMRLWREQGGAGALRPGAYDGEGGSRNRKRGPSNGRPGAGLIETPPMILPVPNMHHDSRRSLRSYRDLDAPEDEVTVIDYRSL